MPDVYIRSLEDIWIDDDNYDRLNTNLWNEFIQSLNADWSDSTTPVHPELVTVRGRFLKSFCSGNSPVVR
ncbi:hypothetical protein QCA50_018696 [Cerrena zonata]|uniref:Uncharacterized protein n=1 Tax=Cerrena zonata TaxID=2478898 RepID=A0AAW0FGE1_9APHY